MRVFRWAARLLHSARPAAVRLCTGAGRACAFVFSCIVSRGGIFAVGLTLVAAGLASFSPEAALIIIGLLLIRDAERPELPDKS